jgi:hypothetical protein
MTTVGIFRLFPFLPGRFSTEKSFQVVFRALATRRFRPRQRDPISRGWRPLSDYAVEALEGRNACLLGHHGLIVTAQTFEKALWLAVEVETLARMYVHALAIGEPPHLSKAEMAQVHEQMKRMGYGQAPNLDGVGDVRAS